MTYIDRKLTGISHLNRLAVQRNMELHPNVPTQCLYTPTYSDRKANDLTKAIITWLKLNGHQAERINTTGRPVDERKTYTDVLGRRRTIGTLKWIRSTTTRGSADISAVINGKAVKIEVKIGKDRQSADQKKYQRDIEQAGGVYIIAKDFQVFYDWYIENYDSELL